MGHQVVAGAVSTAAFFLCEGLLGQHFDVVPDGVAEPQPGDLFLFPLASGGPGWWGAHAGVYCGDGEIIHLEGSSGTSSLGIVAKHGKSHLLRTRGPAKVLRRKGGMDAAALQQRIRAAMDQEVEYDAITCNCVHFALALLGLGQLAGATRGCATGSIPEQTLLSSSRSKRWYQGIHFMLFKSTPRHGKVFKEVLENNLQPGDIVLFPTRTNSVVKNPIFKHVGIYCGDGEVMHFQDTDSQENSSWIIKEGFNAMKRERGRCNIYRKKGGIDLNDFKSKVREAMNSKAVYSLVTNNCNHFALWLLGLGDFDMELVEIQHEGGSWWPATCSPPTPALQRSSHMV
ncbi:uncharacterized protein FYN12_007042 [Phoenicopterus ruber ruber]